MTMESLGGERPRVGFWRRLLALLIDMAVVLVSSQVLVAVLFPQTNGAVQGTYGIAYNACIEVTISPEELQQLQPAPPADANAATVCSTYFFGFETARTLTVSKTTQSGNLTTSVYQVYPLGADGVPRDDVFQTDWLALLLFFAYLVTLECRIGATVGKRIVNIRVFDAAAPDSVGIPPRKAILRQLAMLLGSVPMLLIVFATAFSISEEGLASPSVFMAALFIAGVIGFVWVAWIVISISNKRDPIYDRLVGTAVFRT